MFNNLNPQDLSKFKQVEHYFLPSFKKKRRSKKVSEYYTVLWFPNKEQSLIQVKSREDIFHQLQCKCNLKAGTSTCTGTYYDQWSLYAVVVVVVVMRNFLSWNIPETRSKTSANVVEIGRWRVRYLWPAPYMGCWIMWLVALIRPLYNWEGGKEKRKHHNQVSCRN